MAETPRIGSATGPRPRIDGISYADGRHGCVVVVAGHAIFQTRLYRCEDSDGTPPGMRAMRAAQRWIKARANRADPDNAG